MKVRTFYLLASLATISGWLWVLNQLQPWWRTDHLQACMIKSVTGVACPSCGSTRSVLEILQGDFISAFQFNPIGFVLAGLMVISPLWIGFDAIFRRNTLWSAYTKAETIMKNKWTFISFIILVLINWGWTISKSL